MSPFEKRAVAGLSFIYVARMLGLFMLMPVLALDNDQLR
ncbi:MFS transporter, partial [Acidithiobacillus ferrooxidans]|nr:MFS transporter [Acidithiobacillus ferridurans]MBU2825411.1 MFS transporter [Acidithiobacillus ferrooxidans]